MKNIVVVYLYRVVRPSHSYHIWYIYTFSTTAVWRWSLFALVSLLFLIVVFIPSTCTLHLYIGLFKVPPTNRFSQLLESCIFTSSRGWIFFNGYHYDLAHSFFYNKLFFFYKLQVRNFSKPNKSIPLKSSTCLHTTSRLLSALGLPRRSREVTAFFQRKHKFSGKSSPRFATKEQRDFICNPPLRNENGTNLQEEETRFDWWAGKVYSNRFIIDRSARLAWGTSLRWERIFWGLIPARLNAAFFFSSDRITTFFNFLPFMRGTFQSVFQSTRKR